MRRRDIEELFKAIDEAQIVLRIAKATNSNPATLDNINDWFEKYGQLRDLAAISLTDHSLTLTKLRDRVAGLIEKTSDTAARPALNDILDTVIFLNS